MNKKWLMFGAVSIGVFVLARLLKQNTTGTAPGASASSGGVFHIMPDNAVIDVSQMSRSQVEHLQDTSTSNYRDIINQLDAKLQFGDMWVDTVHDFGGTLTSDAAIYRAALDNITQVYLYGGSWGRNAYTGAFARNPSALDFTGVHIV